MTDFASEIMFVTYKEVMIVWNISERSAALRLNTIRTSLNKQKFHRLTVDQYCLAEDITRQEFSAAINNYFNRISKKAS